MNQTSTELLNHIKKYPLLTPRDTFKFLYQSVFGCEHMVSSSDFVVSYIKEEFKSTFYKKEVVEPLDGNFSRVNLEIISRGMSAETLGTLFVLSSKKEKGTLADLKEKIAILKELVQNGFTPFDAEEFSNELALWESQGFPAIHHSEEFRQNYHPSYRVISNDFIKLLPLLCEIDKQSAKKSVIVSIEGSSASGKTTFGNILKDIYDCNLFHMDDFFLQPHQRTQERLNTPGGNIDSERFLEEILIPLSQKQDVNYHKFRCSEMILEKQNTVIFKPITIIEGAYSMHPDFQKYCDVSAFLDISEDLQKKRILKRNPDMADRFFDTWIPLEHKYFNAFDIKEKCDFIIPIN